MVEIQMLSFSPGAGPNPNGSNFARNGGIDPFLGLQCEVPKLGHREFESISEPVEHC